MAKSQLTDKHLKALQSSPQCTLVIEAISIPNTDLSLYCDVSIGHQRPIVPLEWRRVVFNSLHDLSHPGI